MRDSKKETEKELSTARKRQTRIRIRTATER